VYTYFLGIYAYQNFERADIHGCISVWT
jgi:hypothetical protein